MQKNSLPFHILGLAFLGALATPVAHAFLHKDACLSPAAWTSLEQTPLRPIAAAELLSGMARREVVLLGESHDEYDHHRWQVHTLAALHTMRPNMVIGLEMFPRRVQPALDRWVAGELTLKQFLEQSEWDKVWHMAPDLYVPLFQFARINRIPMVALNVDNALNKAIREIGWDQVPESKREGVGRAAAPDADYLDFLFEVFHAHSFAHGAKAGPARKTDSEFLHFVESQTTWDRAMAEVLVREARSDKPAGQPLVIGIVGSGHVRYGHGVPHQLRALGLKNFGTLLALPADMDCKEIKSGLADAVFALPQRSFDKPDPPRLGVQLDEEDGGVRLAMVSSGSLAERTGLKIGDLLVEIGGVPVTAAAQVAAVVRRQPPGTWLPIRLQRGDKTLEMIVKFPVAP